MRLAIEVTEEEHRQIKTLASYNGQSIKEYVLSRIFPKKHSKCSYGKRHLPNEETKKALMLNDSSSENFNSVKELFESWDKELTTNNED